MGPNSPDRYSMVGKISLIVGGTKGLGRSIVSGLAQAGGTIIVSSRHQEACDRVAELLSQETGVQAAGFACHIGDWDAIEELVEKVYERFGRVDVLVNCPGLSPLYPSLVSVSQEMFDKVVALNMRGPFRLMALVGDRMVSGGGGSIINISSVGSIRPGWGELPYCASKAGLNVLTSGFAQAYAPSVRINTLMPGPFDTDMTSGWNKEFRAIVSGETVLGRIGSPDEIVGAALYLASDASSYMTGATIRVDGGQAISGPSVGDVAAKG